METSIVELDDRGRLTLPSEVRKNLKITQKVLLLNAGDHVKLIPLPADPFNTLHGALSIEKPFNELREEAERIALKEAEG